jgi:hypothetical protein
MRTDRSGCNAECLGNSLIGVATDNELDDLTLPNCEELII